MSKGQVLGISGYRIASIIFLLLALFISLALSNVSILINSHIASLPNVIDNYEDTFKYNYEDTFDDNHQEETFDDNHHEDTFDDNHQEETFDDNHPEETFEN
jgi:hypothetical protein